MDGRDRGLKVLIDDLFQMFSSLYPQFNTTYDVWFDELTDCLTNDTPRAHERWMRLIQGVDGVWGPIYFNFVHYLQRDVLYGALLRKRLLEMLHIDKIKAMETAWMKYVNSEAHERYGSVDMIDNIWVVTLLWRDLDHEEMFRDIQYLLERIGDIIIEDRLLSMRHRNGPDFSLVRLSECVRESNRIRSTLRSLPLYAGEQYSIPKLLDTMLQSLIMLLEYHFNGNVADASHRMFQHRSRRPDVEV